MVTTDIIFQYGLQGIVAYGSVGVISLIAEKRFNKTLGSDVKLYLLVLIAFGVGFVPADLGNVVFQHIKEAVAIAMAIHTGNTVLNKVSG